MVESGALHIVIVDDHPLFRDALKLTLQNKLAAASIEIRHVQRLFVGEPALRAGGRHVPYFPTPANRVRERAV